MYTYALDSILPQCVQHRRGNQTQRVDRTSPTTTFRRDRLANTHASILRTPTVCIDMSYCSRYSSIDLIDKCLIIIIYTLS